MLFILCDRKGCHFKQLTIKLLESSLLKALVNFSVHDGFHHIVVLNGNLTFTSEYATLE